MKATAVSDRRPPARRARLTLRNVAPVLDQLREDFSEGWWRHYAELVRKRQAESLSAGEHRELMALTTTLEEIAVWRARALTGLARALGMSVERLVKAAGIQPRLVG